MGREKPAASFLDEVELRLHELLTPAGAAAGAGVLGAAARHLGFAGGAKRGRPQLVQLFGQLAGAPQQGLVDVAAAAELIHTASLLHDDVVDEGTTRRGVPSVNARWGNTVAVLGGDLLLTAALGQLRRHQLRVWSGALDTVAAMTRATMAEVEARGRLDLSREAWRALAEGKTGVLFGWCGEAAALLAFDEVAAPRFAATGRALGVLFQLADDLADLCDGGSGKDRFADLRNRNPSFPVLHAVAVSAPLRAAVARAWSGEPGPEEVEALGAAVLATGAAEATRARMELEAAQVRELLAPYRDRPGALELAGFTEKLLATSALLPRAAPAPVHQALPGPAHQERAPGPRAR